MADDKQIVAYKIGARARKLLNEDCAVEGYELLYTALAETKDSGDTQMHALLTKELEKYERRVLAAEEE
jgi:hypothetical protein